MTRREVFLLPAVVPELLVVAVAPADAVPVAIVISDNAVATTATAVSCAAADELPVLARRVFPLPPGDPPPAERGGG